MTGGMDCALKRMRKTKAIMRTLLLTGFAIVLTGCAGSRPQALTFSGGDGSSCQQAVVINQIRYRETGRVAEKVWVDRKYPGHAATRASDLSLAGKHYDLVELTTADGQTVKVYFDSTEFCGK